MEPGNFARAVSIAGGCLRQRGNAQLVRASLAVLLALSVAAIGAQRLAVKADHLCADGSLPVHFTPAADPLLRIWDVEGKITAYDVGKRTMTANGMTLSVPADLLIKTIDLDQEKGNLTLVELTDPARERVRSIIGGTVIANGETVFTQEAVGTCMALVATSVFVELAENGVIGPLMGVNIDEGLFIVNGAIVKLNEDPRFPSELVDLGGTPMSLTDLAGNAVMGNNDGILMDIGGYYDAAAGVLYGTVAQADMVKPGIGRDGIAIERATSAQLNLRVVGMVSKHPDTGSLATFVTVYRGGLNSSGGCASTTVLGTPSVDPADKSFDFKRSFSGSSAVPSEVCVVSQNGGVVSAKVVKQ